MVAKYGTKIELTKIENDLNNAISLERAACASNEDSLLSLILLSQTALFKMFSWFLDVYDNPSIPYSVSMMCLRNMLEYEVDMDYILNSPNYIEEIQRFNSKMVEVVRTENPNVIMNTLDDIESDKETMLNKKLNTKKRIEDFSKKYNTIKSVQIYKYSCYMAHFSALGIIFSSANEDDEFVIRLKEVNRYVFQNLVFGLLTVYSNQTRFTELKRIATNLEYYLGGQDGQ